MIFVKKLIVLVLTITGLLVAQDLPNVAILEFSGEGMSDSDARNI